ncbi:maleate cis-trans isomerase family protein [Defluviimonas sp. SAOS-178_SWC]|uniref:maleate cis-trans isomerase family protein n=1 Tax=Defluviimonas sp. SAOS-178_SWC TaxID=3121287 RepID=UPI003221AAAD
MKLPFDTDAGMGRRATFGLIVLPADETLENELRAILPRDGVALYHSRIAMPPKVTPETLAAMERALPAAVSTLPEIDFDVIGYGCTSGATVIGPEGVARAVQSVRPGAQVADPVSAVMAAARHLGARRIGFVSPYVESVSAAMRRLLEANGFEIAGFGSFMESDDRVVARITPEATLAAIEKVAAMAPADAVFVSCTNLRVAGIAEEAERRIGRPVLSSNLALAWQMMRAAGIRSDTAPRIALFSPE